MADNNNQDPAFDAVVDAAVTRVASQFRQDFESLKTRLEITENTQRQILEILVTKSTSTRTPQRPKPILPDPAKITQAIQLETWQHEIKAKLLTWS